jgi:tetratricopeptide (TPR) repeat protein
MKAKAPFAWRQVSCSPACLLTGLLAACFTLATSLQLEFQTAANHRSNTGDLLKVLLGDSRSLFANQFFIQADVCLHGGYYPSIFDQVEPPKQLKIAAQVSSQPDKATHAEKQDDHDQEDHVHQANEEHNDLPTFLHKPNNWIERFGRNFYPSEHRHFDKPQDAAEILPWLLFSAELDPHRIETYTVTAFWLVKYLGKIQEAEEFLRAGLRANPNNPDILFELGRVYNEGRHDAERARNVWETALRNWRIQAAKQPEPDRLLLMKIVTHLADLEEKQQRYPAAIQYLEILKTVSPVPATIQKHIDELRAVTR